MLLILSLFFVSCSHEPATTIENVDAIVDVKPAIVLQKEAIGTINNVHSFGNVYLAGQFEPDDIRLLKEKGIQTVLSLRTDGEVEWDEQKMLEDAGVRFVNVPFRSPESLNDQVFDEVRDLMEENNDQGIMVHCKSANRVGAVWAVVRACDQGLDVETALSEAREVGLTSSEFADKAKDYILRQQNSN